MQDDGETAIREAQRRLEGEARRYLRKAFEQSTEFGRLTRVIRSLTGREPGTGAEWKETRHQLQSLAARERRRARTNPRAYDLNRHIALHQALNGIAAMLDHEEGPDSARIAPSGPSET